MVKLVYFIIPLLFIIPLAFASTYCNCGTNYPVVIYNPAPDYRLYDINNYTGTQLHTYFIPNYEIIDYVKGHSYPSNYTAYLKTLGSMNDNFSLSTSLQTTKSSTNQTTNSSTINYFTVKTAPEPNLNVVPSGLVEIYVYSGIGVSQSLDAFSNNEYWVLSHYQTRTYQFDLTNSGTVFDSTTGKQESNENLVRTPERSLGEIAWMDCMIQQNTMSGNSILQLRQNGGPIFDELINANIQLTIPSGNTGLFSTSHLRSNVYTNTQQDLKINSNSTGEIQGYCIVRQ